MTKTEKIGVIIIAILLIILAISIWAGYGNNKSTGSANNDVCGTMCHKQQENWNFRGQEFSSQEECLTYCKSAIKR